MTTPRKPNPQQLRELYDAVAVRVAVVIVIVGVVVVASAVGIVLAGMIR